MKMNRQKRNSGLTLIEVMIAMIVIVIVVIGSIGYRYHGALDARRSDVQMTAARLGLMLLEDWKGAGATLTYDPVAQFSGPLDISAKGVTSEGLGTPSGYNVLGIYAVVAGNTDYRVILSQRNETPTRPKILNARIAWVRGGDRWGSQRARQSVILTTHAFN